MMGAGLYGGGGGNQPDYIFEEHYDPSFRKGWGEILTYYTGMAYCVGGVSGTTYGLFHGLKETKGEMFKLRMNGIANSVGRYGARAGNHFAVIAMMYGTLESLACGIRDTDDAASSIAAAVGTGLLYKSTAGPKVATVGAVVGGALGAAF